MRANATGTLIWVAIMAVAVIAMLVEAASLPPTLREVPNLLGWAVLVLFALLLVGEVYPAAAAWMDTPLEELWQGGEVNKAGPGDGPDAASNSKAKDAVPWPSVLRVLAYIVGFWALIFLFGLYLVPPFFIVLFLVVEAGVRLRHAVLSALIACVFLFAGLHLLKIDLWVGVVPEIVPGIVGGAVMPSL
jgi:hypothetical protein